MGRIKEIFMKLKPDISIVFFLFVFLVSGVFHTIFYHTKIEIYQTAISEAKTSYEESAWSLTQSAINIASIAAKEKGIEISKKLVNSLEANHDMNALKSSLDAGDITDSGFVNSIHKTIHGERLLGLKNTKNDTFVIYHDTIIEPSIMNQNGTIYQTIESFISSQKNPELAKTAMNVILDSYTSSDLIFMESDESDMASHNLIKDMSKKSIKDVMLSEGLDGLKGFDILIPTYITEDGDVFGTKDIGYDGKLSNNHKIILVQKFNLYDILYIYFNSELASIKSTRDASIASIAHMCRFENIAFMAIMLMDIVFIILVLAYTTARMREKEHL